MNVTKTIPLLGKTIVERGRFAHIPFQGVRKAVTWHPTGNVAVINNPGWIGVDLDGTLAEYDGFQGHEHIGAPIPAMVDRVKAWLAEGQEVKIFTARVADDFTGDIKRRIQAWCLEHIGAVLPVTNAKDSNMVELWDDRAVQVVTNTGEPVKKFAKSKPKARALQVIQAESNIEHAVAKFLKKTGDHLAAKVRGHGKTMKVAEPELMFMEGLPGVPVWLMKFNENHDEHTGEFTSGSSELSITPTKRDISEGTKPGKEEDYLFGGCSSFAVALQERIGGEIHAMYFEGKPMHAFVRVQDKDFDVKGQRGIYAMALGLFGTGVGATSSGPLTHDELRALSLKTPNEKMIERAHAFITLHPSRFTISANKLVKYNENHDEHGRFAESWFVGLRQSELESYSSIEKVAKADNSDAKVLLKKLLPIDWSPLLDEIEPYMGEIAEFGAVQALQGLNITDSNVISAVNEAAADWAAMRSAEMVGMKYIDGVLHENPDARFAISETTRDAIAELVTNAFEEGTGIKELATAIQEAGTFSPFRAKMIAETETTRAQAEGNKAGWKGSGVVKSLDWQLSNDHDHDDICDELADGGPYELDAAPDCPAHPNCLTGNTTVSASGVSAGFKRWYEGEVITLTIAGVEELTVTPNHPILTQRGWIPAGSLQLTDQLLQCGDPSSFVSLINPNDNYMETRVEDILHSLRMTSGSATAFSLPTTAEAFHGDGMPNGKVDVIGATCFFPNRFERYQSFLQTLFCQGWLYAIGILFSRSSSLAEFFKRPFSTTYSIMSGFSSALALFFTSSVYFQSKRFTLSSYWQTCFAERPQEIMMSATNTVCDSIGMFSGNVASVKDRNILIRKPALKVVALSSGSENKTSFLESSSYDPKVTSKLFGELLNRFPLLITPVQLLNIRKHHFVGHVYNLETDVGFYTANSIITHNCMCVLVVAELLEDADKLAKFNENHGL